MTAFSQEVTDAVCRLHSATRTLQIAREVQSRQRLGMPTGFLVDDAMTALARQVREAETELMALLTASDGTIEAEEWTLSATASDRRAWPRPRFVLHKMTDKAPARRCELVSA